MVDFKIVEQSESYEEYYDDYLLFVALYNDKNVTVKQIRKELNLSRNKYKHYLNKALEKGDVVNRNTHINPKYYTKHKNKYVVYHWDKKSKCLVYYGTFRRECHARRVVEELEKVDWDKRYMDWIKRDLRIFY